MSRREIILERLKSATWAKPASRSIMSPEDEAYQGEVQIFIEKAIAAGAQVEELGNIAEVQDRIGQIVAEAQDRKNNRCR